MRLLSIAVVAFATMTASAVAQKPTRFWNLTLYTVTHFQLSPPGKNAWGPDQCKNDRDGTVDHDERLRIIGVSSGRYDAKLSDRTGRVCVVRDVEIKDGGIFTIEEKQLTDCRK